MTDRILTPAQIELSKKLYEAQSLKQTAEYGLTESRRMLREVTRAISKLPREQRQPVWSEAREMTG